jgi:hypothetical protein
VTSSPDKSFRYRADIRAPHVPDMRTHRSIFYHHRNIDANGKGPVSVPLRSLVIRNVIIKKAEARDISDQLSVLMGNNLVIHFMIVPIRYVIM